MDSWLNWETALIGVMTYVAIRSLLTLMHRRQETLVDQVRDQLQQERQQRAAAKRRAKADS